LQYKLVVMQGPAAHDELPPTALSILVANGESGWTVASSVSYGACSWKLSGCALKATCLEGEGKGQITRYLNYEFYKGEIYGTEFVTYEIDVWTETLQYNLTGKKP
jgi:hypothetical protein